MILPHDGPRASALVAAIFFGACAACTTSDAATADGGLDSAAPGSDAATNDAASGDASHLEGPDGAAGPDANADAPSGNDASDAATDDSGATPFTGAIYAISDSTLSPDGGVLVDYSAGGYFADQTTPDQSVTSTNVGPCLLQTYGSGDQGSSTNLSAGTVTITGVKTPISLVPDGTKSYAGLQGTNTDLWNGGGTITVTAAGADVPAFTTSLVAPSKITLTSPGLPSASGTLDIPHGAPWTATWTGASSGLVVLYFSSQDANNGYATTCSFAASAGTGQVPAAAFASFPAGGTGTFNFYVETSSAPSVSGWDIHFNASSAIVDGTGAGATGNTTYP